MADQVLRQTDTADQGTWYQQVSACEVRCMENKGIQSALRCILDGSGDRQLGGPHFISPLQSFFN
jgi:hypothetical protein